MAASKNIRTTAADTPALQPNRTSRQQTPSQSYFSASPSPPPSTPPPPPPVTQVNNVSFLPRAIASRSLRSKYVESGLKQIDQQLSARSKGQPILPLDVSQLSMEDFTQQSSNEDPVERFCILDWVDDPNVIHARITMASVQQQQQQQEVETNAKGKS